MHRLYDVLVLGLLGSTISAAPTIEHKAVTQPLRHIRKITGRASPDVVTPHVLQLGRLPYSSMPLPQNPKSLGKDDPLNGTLGLAALRPFKDVLYYTNITFGDQSFQAVVDTGSSDTWLVRSGFDCANVQTRDPVEPAACKFGPAYTLSSTFDTIEGQNFNIGYGDGEIATGIVGYEDVTLAGITVNRQEVAVVDFAAWNGDGITSGLIGLAYPGLTSSFNGTDPKLDTYLDELEYSPIFTSMYTQGKIAPVFSLALDRGQETGGYLALGGLPPVEHDPYFASTPIETRRVPRASSNPAVTEPQYYTISFTGVTYGNISEAVDLQADVDSGTSLIFLPSPLARRVNALYSVPALFNRATGEYDVACDASVPRLGFQIGGHTFYINPKDLIIKKQNGGCVSGITNAAIGRPGVLGDVFLRNVLAVFDVGAGQMRFSGRENY
ncbi:MAG: hypothetical protein Q9183_003844 [Haloplaca sp. 2 TL-2023]